MDIIANQPVLLAPMIAPGNGAGTVSEIGQPLSAAQSRGDAGLKTGVPSFRAVVECGQDSPHRGIQVLVETAGARAEPDHHHIA